MRIENHTSATTSAPVARDFDHHDCPGVTVDPFVAFDRVRDLPIFWTSAWGGYWVLTRYHDIRAVLEDSDTFSSIQTSIPAAGWPRRLIPTELDPPDHAPYRAMMARSLAGQTGRTIVAAIQRQCVRLVDAVAPRGECNLVTDYARPIQNTLFAALFDVPAADIDACAQWISDVLQHGDPVRRSRAVGQMTEYLGRRAAELRADARDRHDNSGLLATLTHATLAGAPLSDDDIRDISFVMAMASLDTLSNSISFGFRYLADHPELQHRLATGLIQPVAVVDELLRLHSVVSTARTARHDTTLAGATIREGERVLVCLSLADRDPQAYHEPMQVNTDRKTARGHLAFGAGSHRCLGSGIANQAFASALQEWHRRIPSYTLSDHGDEPITSGGAVCSLSSLPLVWPDPQLPANGK
jgi:cytochrome P450